MLVLKLWMRTVNVRVRDLSQQLVTLAVPSFYNITMYPVALSLFAKKAARIVFRAAIVTVLVKAVATVFELYVMVVDQV